MPNTRPAAKGALAMLEAALDRIQALGDPASLNANPNPVPRV